MSPAAGAGSTALGLGREALALGGQLVAEHVRLISRRRARRKAPKGSSEARLVAGRGPLPEHAPRQATGRHDEHRVVEQRERQQWRIRALAAVQIRSKLGASNSA